MRRKLIFIAPLAILGMLVFVAVGGGVVLLLWNWLMPSLFGLRPVTFWEALGILALSRILFGGFGYHGSGRSTIRRRIAERMEARMEERMKERWEQMTPEERDRFQHGMRGRCGFGPQAGEGKQP